MSYTYRNINTGDVHEADKRDSRLDNLDNWELVKPGDDGVCPTCGQAPPVASDGILSRPNMRPSEAFSAAPVVQVDSDGAFERPADRAGKATWIAYAESKGADRAELDGMSRDDIIAKHGK